MSITMIQERVKLLSPLGKETVLFTATGDKVVMTHDKAPGWEDRMSLEEAHETFEALWERGWR